ncbi:SPOR domain-containing protein [Bacillus sp. JJ1609]|uniref:SPOR domain-containing protein n=1 Tax=Bacillus sp. JJ1609 TaxID=3122977 RepID=UPI002FFD59A1
MDKQGRTITIKINGKDRPMKEEKNIKKEEDENHYVQSDRDDALNETAASQESADDSFDWVLPDPIEEEVVKEYKIAPKQPKKQKKSIGISVWNQKSIRKNRLYSTIFITTFFAVLLGTAFGVTILKFVTADTDPVVPAISKVNPSPEKAEEGKGAGSVAAKLNSIPAFVVQNGIFTTEDAAKERVNLLAGQGVTAEIFPANGQFAIYLGTAGTIEEAKQISNTLKAKGVEVFAKPVEIPGGTAANITAEEAKILEKAPEIYSILSSGKEATPETLKKIVEYQIMLSEIPDRTVKDKNILKAKASIERASQAFSDYQKSKDGKQLASMQADLLAFLSAYQSIVK